MDLRTGNEQLRRVNVRIDSLVEDIRTELLARGDVSKRLSDTSIHSLLKYIANPLKNISIDGDEMMLDDMLDLYDLVISKLDQIVQDKKYSDDKGLSKSEIETFEKARDLLKTDKSNGIDVIDQVYTEIIREHREGKLEKTYIGRKKAENKELDEINQKIATLTMDVSKSLRPTLDLMDKLSPEFDLFIDIENGYDKLAEIGEKLDEATNELTKPGLTDEEKEVLEIAQEALALKLVDAIREVNPEFKKDIYNQKQDETTMDYAERLASGYRVVASSNEKELIKKLTTVYGEKINIAEFNRATGTYTIKEVNFKDRYFGNLTPGKNPTNAELIVFSKKIKKDLEELQIAMDSKIDEKTDLEARKSELEEQIENEIKTSTLSVVPYIEKNNGENLSEFAKWRQRMAFRFKNPEIMFKNRKEVEDAMCKDKIKKATISLNREGLLKDVEAQHRKFKDKYRVKTNARTNIYKAWDKNRVPNSRDDSSR